MFHEVKERMGFEQPRCRVERAVERPAPFLLLVLGMDAIAQGTQAQDAAMMKAVDDVARAMSVSISLLADLLDPEVVITGGPLTHWGTPMLELLRRYVGELAGRTATRPGPARPKFTPLGDDVIALGGAAPVMERLFEGVGITMAT
jgi:predicted NBD/HSP70 family sugar kinase